MLRQASLLVGVLVMDILTWVSAALSENIFVADTVSHHCQEAGTETIFTGLTDENTQLCL